MATAMTRLQLFRPDSVADAIDLLRSSKAPVDSPTQRRYRSDRHLEAAFEYGLRRPEWVWAARRGERVVGTVAAAAPGRDDVPRMIDHVSDPGVTATECADFTALATRQRRLCAHGLRNGFDFLATGCCVRGARHRAAHRGIPKLRVGTATSDAPLRDRGPSRSWRRDRR